MATRKRPRTVLAVEALENRIVPAWFLKMDTIPGESAANPIDDKELEIMSFKMGVEQVTTPGSGELTLTDLSITRVMDAASPDLFQHCATGTHIPSAKLFWKNDPSDSETYFQHTLEDILVTSYQTGHGGDGVPTESISMNFAKVVVEDNDPTKDIEVESWSLGATKKGPESDRSVTGTVTLFHLVKPAEPMPPVLLRTTTTGDHVGLVVSAPTGATVPFFSYQFEDSLVSSFQWGSISHGSDHPMESFSLNFTTVNVPQGGMNVTVGDVNADYVADIFTSLTPPWSPLDPNQPPNNLTVINLHPGQSSVSQSPFVLQYRDADLTFSSPQMEGQGIFNTFGHGWTSLRLPMDTQLDPFMGPLFPGATWFGFGAFVPVHMPLVPLLPDPIPLPPLQPVVIFQAILVDNAKPKVKKRPSRNRGRQGGKIRHRPAGLRRKLSSVEMGR